MGLLLAGLLLSQVVIIVAVVVISVFDEDGMCMSCWAWDRANWDGSKVVGGHREVVFRRIVLKLFAPKSSKRASHCPLAGCHKTTYPPASTGRGRNLLTNMPREVISIHIGV